MVAICTEHTKFIKIEATFRENPKAIANQSCDGCYMGHPPSADLRYGEEDSISYSTLIFATIKG